MSKKQLLVTLVLLVLAGAAAYILKDSFKSEPIQIESIIRRAQNQRRPQSAFDAPSGKPGYNVTFAFSQKVSLSAVKVFSLPDAQTNKYPRALWNLTCPSNTVPTKSLVYGGWIRGLQPTVKGATADPLQAGESYRLVVEVNGEKLEHDFQVPR